MPGADAHTLASKHQMGRTPDTPTMGAGSSASSVLSELTDPGGGRTSGKCNVGSSSLSPVILPPLDGIPERAAWEASREHGQLPIEKLGAVTPIHYHHYRALEELRKQRAQLARGLPSTRANFWPGTPGSWHSRPTSPRSNLAPIAPSPPSPRSPHSPPRSPLSRSRMRDAYSVPPAWRVNELVRWRDDDIDRRMS